MTDDMTALSEAPAYRRGVADARRCHREYRRAQIIVGAPNPYKQPETRKAWQAGFSAAYAVP